MSSQARNEEKLCSTRDDMNGHNLLFKCEIWTTLKRAESRENMNVLLMKYHSRHELRLQE